eukprot:CAMPEP_0116118888 /NCGR_PEP_ID=MMETSP0329-20121206/2349_1 /TAXON_ID=697910 /ORGANISM="Pseudo-nitzschia arenysensis, Strain B593" /LENGTH=1086 /DNA_ID=CAMNT_0003612555 /DNA_START=26 /DNA_END=3286 /DNA_ORIENTATION=+
MTRSSESRAQRASRRGRSEDENNPDEREAARQPEERPRSRGHRRRSKSGETAARAAQRQDDDDDDERDERLRPFVQILNQGAPPPLHSKYVPKIDKQKALNILEATAGNMALAANLYWEDYFAANQLGESNQNRKNEESEDQKPAAAEGSSDNNSDQWYEQRRESPKSKRRLRRSLEADFQAADDDDETKRQKRAKKRARKSSQGSQDSNDNDDDDEQKMPAIRRTNNEQQERPPSRRRSSRRPPVEAEDSGASDEDHIISVSDDEFGRVGYYKDSNPARRRSRNPPARKMKEDPVSRSAVMKAARDINLKIDPDTTQLSKSSTWFLSPEEEKRRPRKKDDESVDSNSEDYIGDDDWLGDETQNPSIPMEYVWGAVHDYWTIDPYEEAEAEQKKKDESNGNVTADDDDDDDDENDATEQEKVDEKNKEAFKSVPLLVEGGENRGIPHTWLNAGFQLSECGSGLIIESPTVEEVEFFAWRQKQVNDKRNAVPPPQHCKSLTSITSIVTGLLYSGASIQGNEVNFTSGKAPWASLTAEERKRQFESRLADALSSLIFVAAEASLKRKRKAYRMALKTGEVIHVERNMSDLFKEALEKRNAVLTELEKKQKGETGSEVNVVKDPVNRSFTKEALSVSTDTRELMRRRLELIPTCIWAEKKDVVKPRPGDALCFFNVDAKVKTSWTNIRDIKLYVESNLRAFTEKGGIALFLETLLRIHGDNFIGRQLIRCASVTSSISVTGKRGGEIPEKGSRGEFICKGGKTTVPLQTVYAAGYPSLIRCTCECRQKKIHEENPLPLNVRTDPSKLLDTTPPGTECVSIEFLSLILTGRVSSSWKDCSSDKLGIGILTETAGEVSQSLARPKQPVWIIKGETCYTMLAIDGAWSRNGASNGNCGSSSHGEDLKTISRVDKPNVALNVIHWNSWYGQRSKTGMRLVTPYSKKAVPSKKLLSQFSEPAGKTDTKSLIMRRRRHEHVLNVISAEQHTSSQENAIPIRPMELKRIHIHEQDQKLYPNNHKMWRFDLGENDDENDLDKKPSATSWIPYFKLNPRQKRLVETKLGPKINSILWTRWPGAVIDNFTDSEEGFPVV